MPPLLIRNVRRWAGPTPGAGPAAPADLLIDEGRIQAVGAALAAPAHAQTIDGTGCLVLPGLVDGHAHLDKTLWGTPWHPHRAGPTLRDRIDNERRVLSGLALSPREQSARILRRMVACGTTHCRTHVDVGPDIGLAHFHGVLDMRAAHRDWIDLQVVAFPQTGVMVSPGTLELLEQAAREGAEVLGGLDPMGIDHDPKGQLDGLFAIAGRYGVELDIHLHDRGELGAATIEMVAQRTRALGLRGRVALSHAFCLGQLEAPRLEQLIELLLDNDIAVMSHAPAGPTPFPPLRLLHERGVRLFTGSDGVRDTWSPLNNGDMLERAYLIAYRSGFRDDDGLELALHMATHGGAQVMRSAGFGVQPGDQADLVLVQAECAPEAVCFHPPRRWVIKRGRVVARDGVTL